MFSFLKKEQKRRDFIFRFTVFGFFLEILDASVENLRDEKDMQNQKLDNID